MLAENVGFVCTARALVRQIQDGDPPEPLATQEIVAKKCAALDLDHPYVRVSSAAVGGDVAAVEVGPSVARVRGAATTAPVDPPEVKVVTELEP